MQKAFAKPSVKQHLAAIRMLFDWLVTGGILATNPAHAVRGPTHVVKHGKTPMLTPEEARALLDSIDTSTVVGLRDRALIRKSSLYFFLRLQSGVNTGFLVHELLILYASSAQLSETSSGVSPRISWG